MGNNLVPAALSCWVWKSTTVSTVRANGKLEFYAAGEGLHVADVLRAYPHHYVCEIDTNPASQLEDSSILPLPLERKLEPGHTYGLIALPIVFSVTRRRTPRSYAPACCTDLTIDDMSGSDYSLDEYDDSHRRRTRRPIGRLFHRRSPQQSEEKSPERLRHDKEMRWLLQGKPDSVVEVSTVSEWPSKTWEPKLESIKEEPTRLRQTLSSLMESADVER